MSGVIYQFTCAKCNLSYVGCTKRFWETRLQEHSHVSGLTGKPLHGMQMFAPMQHVRAGCHVNVERKNFKIIGHEKDRYLLQLKESIIINHCTYSTDKWLKFLKFLLSVLFIYVFFIYVCLHLIDGRSIRPKRKIKMAKTLLVFCENLVSQSGSLKI